MISRSNDFPRKEKRAGRRRGATPIEVLQAEAPFTISGKHSYVPGLKGGMGCQGEHEVLKTTPLPVASHPSGLRHPWVPHLWIIHCEQILLDASALRLKFVVERDQVRRLSPSPSL